MKTIALSLVVTFSLSLSVIAAAGAQQREEPRAPKLYQQCQDLLRKEPNNREAKQLCDEGMRLHREGKQEEAVRKLREGLEAGRVKPIPQGKKPY